MQLKLDVDSDLTTQAYMRATTKILKCMPAGGTSRPFWSVDIASQAFPDASVLQQEIGFLLRINPDLAPDAWILRANYLLDKEWLEISCSSEGA